MAHSQLGVHQDSQGYFCQAAFQQVVLSLCWCQGSSSPGAGLGISVGWISDYCQPIPAASPVPSEVEQWYINHFPQFCIIYKNQNTDLKTEPFLEKLFRQQFASSISFPGIHCKVSIPISISMPPGTVSKCMILSICLQRIGISLSPHYPTSKIPFFISRNVSWAGVTFPEPFKKVKSLTKLGIRTKELWSQVTFCGSKLHSQPKNEGNRIYKLRG